MTTGKSDFRTPPRALAIGMYLFLCSLGMLFLASMFGYFLIRTRLAGNASDISIILPKEVWASTAIMLLASFTIHSALGNIRLERHSPFRFFLGATLLLAVAFLIIQTPVMASLLHQHRALGGGTKSLYGLVFFLVLLHALHVVGGVIAMIIVNVRAALGKYDHESNMGVRHAALYWHFLDIVWLIMLTLFLITG